MEKIINFKDVNKMHDVKAFFNIFRKCSFLQIYSIDNCVIKYGLVKQHNAVVEKYGLVFGDAEEGDFVTLEDEPKVYPYYVRMADEDFSTSDKPGIYVASMKSFKINDDTLELYEQLKDDAKRVEEWYFEVYLKNAINEDLIVKKQLEIMDKVISELEAIYQNDNKKNNIIEFKKK